MTERIAAAAIRSPDGTVWTLPRPARHCDVICHIWGKTGKPTIGNSGQGFLTDQGRFVTREEAYRIAKAADQIIFRPDVTPTPGTLYTEDLW